MYVSNGLQGALFKLHNQFHTKNEHRDTVQILKHVFLFIVSSGKKYGFFRKFSSNSLQMLVVPLQKQ